MNKFITSVSNGMRAALASKRALPRDYFGRPMDRKDTPAPSAATIKTMEDLRTAFLEQHRELTQFIEKANGELKETGKVANETASAMRALSESLNTLGTRLDKVEGKADRLGEGERTAKSLGEQFVESEEWASSGALLKVAKARWETRAIVNATGQNQPLVPDMRVPGIVATPNRRLRIRQLLPAGTTSSNLVQFAKENVFTNNAGPQAGGSPTVAAENVVKPESDITFTLANAPVVTIAHFILASRQVLDDAPMLASYINGRLQYGLALEEDEQLLLGDGTVGKLDGLMNQATFYNRAQTGTKLDWLRRAITQLQLSEYDAEFMVLNPADWEDIELTKDQDLRYLIANPVSILGPQLWGLPVVPTNTMPEGQFLVANGSMAAQIWDRSQAAIEVSREDSDNFRRNMVTLLAEERLALTVYRPSALIKGVFSV
jgi:HK97 family phage major capsid protein